MDVLRAVSIDEAQEIMKTIVNSCGSDEEPCHCLASDG